LQFEHDFLGYYWHSPTELFHTRGDANIESAKIAGYLEGVITDKFVGATRKGNKYMRLTITDGKKDCMVMLWSNDIDNQNSALLKIDAGIKLNVEYDPDRNSFMLSRGTVISPLWTRKGWEDLQEGIFEEEKV
jgi:DNA polymerase III alpha subunit